MSRFAVSGSISVLGVDYGAGKNITFVKMKERLQAARKKAAKIMALTKGGWRALNMMHSHVVSSVTYSARVNGVDEEDKDPHRRRG